MLCYVMFAAGNMKCLQSLEFSKHDFQFAIILQRQPELTSGFFYSVNYSLL